MVCAYLKTGFKQYTVPHHISYMVATTTTTSECSKEDSDLKFLSFVPKSHDEEKVIKSS